jgi:hypothetical protein
MSESEIEQGPLPTGSSSSYLLEFPGRSAKGENNGSPSGSDEGTSRRSSIEQSFGHTELSRIEDMISQNRLNAEKRTDDPMDIQDDSVNVGRAELNLNNQ